MEKINLLVDIDMFDINSLIKVINIIFNIIINCFYFNLKIILNIYMSIKL